MTFLYIWRERADSFSNPFEIEKYDIARVEIPMVTTDRITREMILTVIEENLMAFTTDPVVVM